MKYKFVQISDISHSKLTLEFYAVSLDDVLDQFETFLRGSGYVLPGTLTFLQEDTHNDE